MADTARRRGSYSVGIARRAKILDVAVRQFGRSGYNRSSLGALAREVGISEAGLLHHFASKEELLLEVLRHSEELDCRAMAEAGIPAAGPDYLAVLQWCADRNVERPGIVQLFGLLSAEATAEDHPAHAWFAERYRRLTALVEESLRAGVRAGEIRSDLDCVEVARELLSVSDGLQIQWLLAGRGFDLPGAYRGYVERLRAAIAAPPRPAPEGRPTSPS